MAGSVFVAQNGTITVQNTNAAGSILFGANTVVDTTGANGGSINAFIGTALGTPTNTAVPAHVLVNNLLTNKVFFGSLAANTITGVLAGAVANTLSTDGQNINFNTAKPTAITLNGNVQMTADPFNTSPALLTPAVLLPAVGGPARSNAGAASFVGSSSSSATASNSLSIAQNSPLQAAAIHDPTTFSQSIPVSSVAMTNVSTVNQIQLNQPNLSQTALVNSIYSQQSVASAVGAAAGNEWLTETELNSGLIPAFLSSESDFGISQEGCDYVNLAQERVDSNSAMTLRGIVSNEMDASKIVNLEQGSVVFAPKVDTLITTAFGKVKIDAGSVVLVMALHNGLAIYNIDDTHFDAVLLDAGKSKISLSPGKMVVLTEAPVMTFAEINPAQTFAYRNLQATSLEGLKAFTGDFWLPLALSNVGPLRKLIANHQNNNAKKVVEHLLKTAAITSQLRGAAGFTQLSPATLTSFQQ